MKLLGFTPCYFTFIISFNHNNPYKWVLLFPFEVKIRKKFTHNHKASNIQAHIQFESE